MKANLYLKVFLYDGLLGPNCTFYCQLDIVSIIYTYDRLTPNQLAKLEAPFPLKVQDLRCHNKRLSNEKICKKG